MSDELVRENYHGKERVTRREEEVLQRWRDLLLLLDRHKTNLTMLCGLMAVLREVDTVMTTIADLHVSTSRKLSTCKVVLQEWHYLPQPDWDTCFYYAAKVVLKHKTFSYKYSCCVTLATITVCSSLV
jgi:hypothetical protein